MDLARDLATKLHEGGGPFSLHPRDFARRPDIASGMQIRASHILAAALLVPFAGCVAGTADSDVSTRSDDWNDGVSGPSPGGYGSLDLSGGPTTDWVPYDPVPLADQQLEEIRRADSVKATKAHAECSKGCSWQRDTSEAKCPPGSGQHGRDRTCVLAAGRAEWDCRFRCDMAYDHAVGRDR